MLKLLHKINSRIRLQWGANFLFHNGVRCGRNLPFITSDANPEFTMNFDLPAGWYMLEIQIVSARIRSDCNLFLDAAPKTNALQAFDFPLYSGRTCKRLIKLNASKRLRFRIPHSQASMELHHFRLVRVTQGFALSRMLRKLKALHPEYKLHRFKQDNTRTKSESDLSIVWNDYCALFDGSADIVPYPTWIATFDTLNDNQRIAINKQMQFFSHTPLISVVMPVYNPNPAWLEQAIESVISQLYSNWELCIADDASTDPAIRQVLEHYSRLDARIKILFRTSNGHISEASNSALSLVNGEWVALLDHDDLLAETALYWVVDAINTHPDCRMIYSDEDKIDEIGERSDPYFKSDWNHDLFYSQNMFSHLGVYHTALVHDVGGFRNGFEGSQDYDLALRCSEKIAPGQIFHIPRILYHWRMHADSTALSNETKPYAMIAGERAINEHLRRSGINASAEFVGDGYRVRYSLPACPPMVSLIIPTRNGAKLLRNCLESILQKTVYPNYEIVVIDNGSDDGSMLRFLRSLASETRIRIIRDDRPFNYSALNNAAVHRAKGELIGLVNNDIEVINPEWLSEMVSHAIRPEIGVVGARLWYPDDTLQHAGVVLGVDGVAGHVHRFLPRGDFGYCGRATLIQSFSAVTGACMLVKKSMYEKLGGLNEVELQVTCNDIDFCLRVQEAGYRNIWTPYAELYHHESASRGYDDTPDKVERSAKEVAYMKQHWGDLLNNDPAYNPNLSLDVDGFNLAWPPRLQSLSVPQDYTGS